MNPIIYAQTGEEMRVGDKVVIHRRIRRDLIGEVSHVYDDSKPSPMKGNNNFGFEVRIGKVYRSYNCQPPIEIELLERSN